MTKVGILGANGRMGRILIEAATLDEHIDIGFASVRAHSPFKGMDVGQLAGVQNQSVLCSEQHVTKFAAAEVVVDFTLPEALILNLDTCIAADLPIVIGTTGLHSAQLDKIDEAAKHIPIVFAANYSVGVNVMLQLVKQASRVMDDADIEIVEAHHRFKKDAPSGTALAIGESIADELNRDLSQCAVYGREGDTAERDRTTIGFATIRAGDIVGEHTAIFATLSERIEITHKASSRLTFANGAMKAAKWLKNKPAGLYSMQDVLSGQ